MIIFEVAEKSPNIWATFQQKMCCQELLKKSPNLVTLISIAVLYFLLFPSYDYLVFAQACPSILFYSISSCHNFIWFCHRLLFSCLCSHLNSPIFLFKRFPRCQFIKFSITICPDTIRGSCVAFVYFIT